MACIRDTQADIWSQTCDVAGDLALVLSLSSCTVQIWDPERRLLHLTLGRDRVCASKARQTKEY